MSTSIFYRLKKASDSTSNGHEYVGTVGEVVLAGTARTAALKTAIKSDSSAHLAGVDPVDMKLWQGDVEFGPLQTVAEITFVIENNNVTNPVEVRYAEPASEPSKEVSVIFPALDKHESAYLKKLVFQSAEGWKEYCKSERGILESGDGGQPITDYSQLKNGGVYLMGGQFRNSAVNDTSRRQADDRVLEVECGLATKRTCDSGDAHVHNNIKFADQYGITIMELDNVVVHSARVGTPDATAFIVECAYSPQPKEVDILLKKVEKFKKLAPTDPHFRNCTTFVPVLGGRNWSLDTLQLCAQNKVSTVKPTGAGYVMKRAFATLSRRFPK